jgi:hypothetical protein
LDCLGYRSSRALTSDKLLSPTLRERLKPPSHCGVGEALMLFEAKYILEDGDGDWHF